MTHQVPPFDELVDPGDPERDRLLEAHALLAAAGAPPELPPSLQSAPVEPPSRARTRRRRRSTSFAAVAVAAAVLFGIGYAVGGRDRPAEPAARTIAMSGPAGAAGSIALLSPDDAGNWPMTLEVAGLEPLPAGSTYTLWLTRDGALIESCGAFVVASGTTRVPLNAPYPLKTFDGWVVVKSGTAGPFLLQTGTV